MTKATVKSKEARSVGASTISTMVDSIQLSCLPLRSNIIPKQPYSPNYSQLGPAAAEIWQYCPNFDPNLGVSNALATGKIEELSPNFSHLGWNQDSQERTFFGLYFE